MNTEALFIFLILLLGLVLCYFLGDNNYGKEGFGGNFSGTFNMNDTNNQLSSSGTSTSSGNQYDNYNHYSGSSTQLSPGNTFYGQNGTTAVVVTNSDGSNSLQITLPGSSSPVTFTQQQHTDASLESFTGSATTYYGPNGYTATIVNSNNGQQAVKVTTSNGTYYYNTSGTNVNETNSSTQYYGSTGTPIQSSSAYQGPYDGSAGSATGPNGNTAYYAQGPNGNAVAGTTNNDYDYSNSLPIGIPGNQIPPGQEDLYILKSQIVPPVCPVCPVASSNFPREKPCPACPACARCPESSFECKKVPNYNAINDQYLPQPVLSDFSSFGI